MQKVNVGVLLLNSITSHTNYACAIVSIRKLYKKKTTNTTQYYYSTICYPNSTEDLKKHAYCSS